MYLLGNSLEEEIIRQVEQIVGKRIEDIAYRSLVKAALLGLPIFVKKYRNRIVYVRYRLRGNYFRVTAVSSISTNEFIVCLKRYESDRGELAVIKPDGNVVFLPQKIPHYLAVPGNLFTTHVADVWTARLEAVVNGMLERQDRSKIPGDIRKIVEKVSAERGLKDLDIYYSITTLDYVLGRDGVYPVWISSVTGSFTVSDMAIEKLSEDKGN